MIKLFKTWLHDEKAATAVEYGIIAAGIGLTISGALFLFGDEMNTLLFERLPEALSGGS